jgi:hypothetical protein
LHQRGLVNRRYAQQPISLHRQLDLFAGVETANAPLSVVLTLWLSMTVAVGISAA